ncbi:HNH endonuclease family protein [Lysinibacter cavernae]|uniref:HNH endonuclease family protein n=1 Tax=Lysinibacter cavernae TaxID=1640652 RepID=UPI003623D617
MKKNLSNAASFAVAAGIVVVLVVTLFATGKWNQVVVEPASYIFGETVGQFIDQAGQDTNTIVQEGAEVISSGELLNHLPAIPNSRTPSYDRSKFGPSWFDVDGNGCSTRNDILIRDLQNVVMDPNKKCAVASGTLSPDPYTGQTINFVSGADTSYLVQIDHVVPLSLAWKSGASSWTDEQRLQFANDPENLIASDGPENASKSDKGLSEWSVPKNPSFTCQYTTKHLEVLSKYSLGISDADRAAAERIFATC